MMMFHFCCIMLLYSHDSYVQYNSFYNSTPLWLMKIMELTPDYVLDKAMDPEDVLSLYCNVLER